MSELYKIVNDCKNKNKDSILIMVEKFTLLIKKYSKRLGYDGADTDLIITLIETINALPIFGKNVVKEDKYIVGYITTSIKHKYIYLSKKYSKAYEKEVELNLDITSTGESNIMEEERVLVRVLLDKLPELQRNIIIKKFIKDCTEVEIANELNISRQAVNRAKNRALKNLKKYLEKNIGNHKKWSS